MQTIRIGIVGVGGYAKSHLRLIDEFSRRGECRLEAAAIRHPDKYGAEERELRNKGVRTYRSLEEMCEAERGRMDMVVIPTDISAHASQSICALSNGYHVLCEKPVAGSADDALAMRKVAASSGKTLAIAFQHVYRTSVQRMRRLASSGDLGPLKSARMITYQPRNAAYYKRNSWAGRIAINGSRILDSPLQNADAHTLNTMLAIAWPPNGSPEYSIYGENYRVKEIESADTQFVRIVTGDGVVLSGMGSHAVRRARSPKIEFVFERGSVVWQGDQRSRVFAVTDTGNELIEEWEQPDEDPSFLMYSDLLSSLRDNRDPMCHIDHAMGHALCLHGLFESCDVHSIPREFADQTTPSPEVYSGPENDQPAGITVVQGLEDTMEEMDQSNRSFAEIGVPWAVKGATLSRRREPWSTGTYV